MLMNFILVFNYYLNNNYIKGVYGMAISHLQLQEYSFLDDLEVLNHKFSFSTNKILSGNRLFYYQDSRILVGEDVTKS